MIKTVIFDLDGLLVNSELMTYEFYKRILAEKGTDFPLKHIPIFIADVPPCEI